MMRRNIVINDIRSNNLRELDDLIFGECFLYKDILYINMGVGNVYDLKYCNMGELPVDIKVEPVKIEINIVE